MVDQMIAKHCSQFPHLNQAGAATCSKTLLSHNEEKTAEATCNEGQAFPDASMPLMKVISGYKDQSISAGGTAVGKIRNIKRHVTHNAVIQSPNHAKVRELFRNAGGKDT